MVSLTNQTVNRFVSKCATNGVEGSLAIAAFYYFIKIKPTVNDRSLNLMTFFITIAFIIRSSSLAPWIPLALLKIFENPNYFGPIVNAGFVVTLPMLFISIAIDSWYYGVFTIPQVNFLRVNVVENLSKHFGVDNWYLYILALDDEFFTIRIFGLFGFALLTIQQLHGNLRLPVNSRIPCFFIYSVTTIAMLSSVPHKEARFYSPVIQLACMYQGFAYTFIHNMITSQPLLKFLRKLLLYRMAIEGILICVS